MAESIANPTCPDCGSTMVRRERRSDGAASWGCSTFPVCRGTREIAPATATPNRPGGGTPTGQQRDRSLHFDQLTLGCGAVGLLIGLGFVIVGIDSRPSTYAFVGVILIALTALVVLPSPWLPPRLARSIAVRVALLSVLLAVFFIAWIPVSEWLGQAFANQMLQAVPTNSPGAH